jgi:hypothetical protein
MSPIAHPRHAKETCKAECQQAYRRRLRDGCCNDAHVIDAHIDERLSVYLSKAQREGATASHIGHIEGVTDVSIIGRRRNDRENAEDEPQLLRTAEDKVTGARVPPHLHVAAENRPDCELPWGSIPIHVIGAPNSTTILPGTWKILKLSSPLSEAVNFPWGNSPVAPISLIPAPPTPAGSGVVSTARRALARWVPAGSVEPPPGPGNRRRSTL